jgi:chromosome segregation ATPase
LCERDARIAELTDLIDQLREVIERNGEMLRLKDIDIDALRAEVEFWKSHDKDADIVREANRHLLEDNDALRAEVERLRGSKQKLIDLEVNLNEKLDTAISRIGELQDDRATKDARIKWLEDGIKDAVVTMNKVDARIGELEDTIRWAHDVAITDDEYQGKNAHRRRELLQKAKMVIKL